MKITLAYIPDMDALKLIVIDGQCEGILSSFDWPWLAAHLNWIACEQCEDKKP